MNNACNFEKRIGISISAKYGRFTIYRATLEVLGYPEYYRFLLNVDEKKLVIQVCGIDDTGAHRLPEIKPCQCCDVKSIQMARLVFKTCSWDERYTYSIIGTGYPDQGLVQYDLKEAMQLKDDEDK